MTSNARHFTAKNPIQTAADHSSTRRWVCWSEAVKAGLLSDTLQAEFSQLEGNKRAIEQELATEPPPPIRLHPNLAETYRKKVENLTEALNADETRQEAGEIIRGLIDEIRLVPDGDELRIHLKGELAKMLAISTNQKPGTRGSGLKTTLVAGARNQRCLRLDEVWL